MKEAYETAIVASSASDDEDEEHDGGWQEALMAILRNQLIPHDPRTSTYVREILAAYRNRLIARPSCRNTIMLLSLVT